MDRDDQINKLQARVQSCRNLAKYATDDRARKNLEAMAAESEAEVTRLRAELPR